MRLRRELVEIGDIWHTSPDGPKDLHWPHGELFVVKRIGVIYDSLANVARGYEGSSYAKSGMKSLDHGVVLGYKIARGYMRSKVRKGRMRLLARVGDAEVAQKAARAWADDRDTTTIVVPVPVTEEEGIGIYVSKVSL